jgi:cell fate regulator YaaT (PSP1 superfamily)
MDSTEGYFIPEKYKSNGLSHRYGYSQSDVYNWLSDVVMPTDYNVCNIIEVKFKGSRKEFYFNLQNSDLKNGELVAVEGNKGGYDVGHVSLTGELVRMQLKKKNVSSEDVVKKIYRIANPADISKWKLAKELELDTLYKARSLAKELGLSMKLTDVDYQGDTSKATFYYIAEGRVDFRELIKLLFEAFHVRIEMRQIGTREEASRIGDIGPCGSPICCHTWSTNFKSNSPFATRYQKDSKRDSGKFECYIKDETLNKDGSKLEELKVKPQGKKKGIVDKPMFYTNVVGQDSITRFDDKEKKHKKKQKNKNRKQATYYR